MNNDIDTIYYTIQEVANELRIHDSTVRTQIHTGQLKAIKFGKSWRIKEEDLKNYLARYEKYSQNDHLHNLNKLLELVLSFERDGDNKYIEQRVYLKYLIKHIERF